MTVTNGDQELVEAAAAGAAAAVDAVQDEQQEQARVDDMAEQTVMAADAAQRADVSAENATEAAETATAAAVQASEQAAVAGDVAAGAAEIAYSARDDIAALREEHQRGLASLRDFITEKLAPPAATNEPTEVVVTNAGTDQATSQPSNSGSGGSAGNAERHGLRRRRR